jgi:hypothetical protein
VKSYHDTATKVRALAGEPEREPVGTVPDRRDQRDPQELGEALLKFFRRYKVRSFFAVHDIFEGRGT